MLRSDGLDVLVWSPGAPFAERRKHGIRVYSFSHRDASTASTSTPPLPTRQKAQRRQRRRGGSLGWIRRPSHGCSRNTCNDFYDIVTILRRPQLPIMRGDRLMLSFCIHHLYMDNRFPAPHMMRRSRIDFARRHRETYNKLQHNTTKAH